MFQNQQELGAKVTAEFVGLILINRKMIPEFFSWERVSMMHGYYVVDYYKRIFLIIKLRFSTLTTFLLIYLYQSLIKLINGR